MSYGLSGVDRPSSRGAERQLRRI